MFGLSINFKVYVAIGATDMRKSINGLSLLVEDQFDLDLFSGNLFGVSFLAYLLSAIVDRISSRFSIGQSLVFVSG